MDFQRATGEALRELRVKAGLSQHDLASRASVNKNVVGLIERGEQEPSLHTIFLLARGLNLEVTDLILTIQARKPRLRDSNN